MKRLIILPCIALTLLSVLAACGIKDPPRYVPDQSKSDVKKAE